MLFLCKCDSCGRKEYFIQKGWLAGKLTAGDQNVANQTCVTPGNIILTSKHIQFLSMIQLLKCAVINCQTFINLPPNFSTLHRSQNNEKEVLDASED